jgi:hypothetical protein
MVKNIILVCILIVALFAAYSGKDAGSGDWAGTVSAQTGMSADASHQSTPAQTSKTMATSLHQALNQTNMPMQNQTAGQTASTGAQSGTQQQNGMSMNSSTGNMGGMGCGMMNGMGMGNMGNMSNMSNGNGTGTTNTGSTNGMSSGGCMGGGGMGMGGNMGNMGGMGMGMGGMNRSSQTGVGHTMDQGLTMKELVFIVSMQDTLQVMNEMIQIQEKLMDGGSPKKDALKQQLANAKEKTKKLIADYRGMLTSQIRSD